MKNRSLLMVALMGCLATSFAYVMPAMAAVDTNNIASPSDNSVPSSIDPGMQSSNSMTSTPTDMQSTTDMTGPGDSTSPGDMQSSTGDMQSAGGMSGTSNPTDQATPDTATGDDDY